MDFKLLAIKFKEKSLEFLLECSIAMFTQTLRFIFSSAYCNQSIFDETCYYIKQKPNTVHYSVFLFVFHAVCIQQFKR